MAPTTKSERDVTFFIADRLRGIPLVTSRYQQAEKVEASTEKPISTQMPSVNRLIESSVSYITTPMSVASTLSTIASGPRDNYHLQNNQADATDAPASVAKRDLDSANRMMRDRDKTKPEILFKAQGITASTANLIRPTKLASTTPRPVRTTTTIALNNKRAKQIYTSTTTPRPRIRSNPPTIRSNPAPARSSKPLARSSGTTTTIRPTVLSKLQFGSSVGNPIEENSRQIESSSTTSTTTMQPIISTTTSEPDPRLAKLLRSDALWNPTSGFTRATLSSTTQPDHQRRNPQTVSSSRFVNRPADGRSTFAGENWVLFNRNDGNFSFFEGMVLMSNIMIVSTIILVIVFNWVKSMRKKKSSNTSAKTIAQPSEANATAQTSASTSGMATNNNSKIPGTYTDLVSDRGSKMSMISSGLSGLTTASTSENSGAQQQKVPNEQEQKPTQPSTTMTSNQQMNNEGSVTAPTNSSAVGAPLRIANEFRSSGGINMANKAMAIVQPTENNSNNQSDPDKLVSAIKDELSAQSRAISRSVSDLSGDARQKPVATKDPGAKASQTTDSIDTSESNRVAALEDLFNGKSKTVAKNNADAREDSKTRRASVSSLESVELPENLVESIEKSISKKPENVPMPSPNLLLGEVDPPSDTAKSNSNAKKKPEDMSKGAATILNNNVGANSTSNSKKDSPQALRRSKTSDNVVSTSNGIKSKQNTSVKQEPVPANNQKRPENPMGRMIEDKPATTTLKQQAANGTQVEESNSNGVATSQTEVKNHQLVVNKLDKRKTDLEIVDIRDESVTGKMRDKNSAKQKSKDPLKSSIDPNNPNSVTPADDSAGWISMEGVAVTKPAFTANNNATPGASSPVDGQSPGALIDPKMSPSEIIENKFHVDYASKRRAQRGQSAKSGLKDDSIDSKAEEYNFNNIENELEKDNKMKNRKYFVYIVHDGHFTAKKECIARIDLPSTKRRVTLAEMRQLIANSQDISLVSLRRNRFKFVTETYRLLNENEDAAVLHQVYPTQGVFLKLNIPEQENQAYLYKTSRGRTSTPGVGGAGSGGGGGSNAATPSSLSQATISSRRKVIGKGRGAAESGGLPAIEVDFASGGGHPNSAYGYGRSRATSVGRQSAQRGPGGAYRRSKSSVHTGARGSSGPTGRGRGVGVGGAAMRRSTNNLAGSGDRLPSLGRSTGAMATAKSSTSMSSMPTRYNRRVSTSSRGSRGSGNGVRSSSLSTTAQKSRSKLLASPNKRSAQMERGPSPNKTAAQAIGTAATDLGANMISGAKKLFSTTFGL